MVTSAIPGLILFVAGFGALLRNAVAVAVI